MTKYFNYGVTMLIVLTTVGYFTPVMVKIFPPEAGERSLHFVCVVVHSFALASIIISFKAAAKNTALAINLLIYLLIIYLFFFFIKNWQVI